MYALSSHSLFYAHRIPNVSPGLAFGEAYIRKDAWVGLQGTYTWGPTFEGAYIRNFTVLNMTNLEGGDRKYIY